MKRVVFVHGIGVRDGAYPSVWPHVEKGLKAPAIFCYWGGEHGARLDGATAPAEPLPDDLWAVSMTDPWWELAALAEKAAHQEPAPLPPHLTPPGPILRRR